MNPFRRTGQSQARHDELIQNIGERHDVLLANMNELGGRVSNVASALEVVRAQGALNAQSVSQVGVDLRINTKLCKSYTRNIRMMNLLF